MSLARLPFLISATLGAHISVTPPQAPPLPSERMPPTGLEVLAAPWFPVVVKIVLWAIAIPEAVVILANNIHPSHSMSRMLIKLFIPNGQGSASNIQLTVPFVMGWSLNLFGALLRRHCYHTLGRQFTFELGIREDHKLITTGPYAIVRHPSYTGAIFAAMGITLCHLSIGSWLRECSGLMLDSWSIRGVIWVALFIVVIIGLRSRMQKEDSMLMRRFGKQWDQWVVRVPYRLFPGIV